MELDLLDLYGHASDFSKHWGRTTPIPCYGGPQSIFANAFGGEFGELFPRMKIISGLEPLLRVSVEAAEMPAGKVRWVVIAEHRYHRGIRIMNDSESVARNPSRRKDDS